MCGRDWVRTLGRWPYRQKTSKIQNKQGKRPPFTCLDAHSVLNWVGSYRVSEDIIEHLSHAGLGLLLMNPRRGGKSGWAKSSFRFFLLHFMDKVEWTFLSGNSSGEHLLNACLWPCIMPNPWAISSHSTVTVPLKFNYSSCVTQRGQALLPNPASEEEN